MNVAEQMAEVRRVLDWHDTTPHRWQDLAACKGLDTAAFYPPLRDRGGITQAEYRRQLADATEARKVCDGCPVREECADAGRYEQGIWGGETERERNQIGNFTDQAAYHRALHRRRELAGKPT